MPNILKSILVTTAWKTSITGTVFFTTAQEGFKKHSQTLFTAPGGVAIGVGMTASYEGGHGILPRLSHIERLQIVFLSLAYLCVTLVW